MSPPRLPWKRGRRTPCLRSRRGGKERSDLDPVVLGLVVPEFEVREKKKGNIDSSRSQIFFQGGKKTGRTPAHPVRHRAYLHKRRSSITAYTERKGGQCLTDHLSVPLRGKERRGADLTERWSRSRARFEEREKGGAPRSAWPPARTGKEGNQVRQGLRLCEPSRDKKR